MHPSLEGTAAVAIVVLLVAGCDAGVPAATPPITPGTSAVPRDVNIVARDYAYVPSTVDLVPGETVRLHVINGGLVIHEAILGDLGEQLAWEEAERPFADPPPGPTPVVPVPDGFDGLRVVVEDYLGASWAKVLWRGAIFLIWLFVLIIGVYVILAS